MFLATSLDGFIADKNNGLEWLEMIPNPDNNDMGYGEFIKDIDAIIMGRTTFDVVLSFGIDWPYNIPVFVVSNSLQQAPEKYKDKVEIVAGTPAEIQAELHAKGFKNLYIDGGQIIQSFLAADLIDDLIITTIPILLGGGIPLFGDLSNEMKFELTKSEVYLEQIVQSHYTRKQ